MSQLPMIIVLKQWHDSKIELMSQETSRVMAESKAELLYIERKAHSVEIWEVNKHAFIKEDLVNVIFKIERTCIHKVIQRNFLFDKGTSTLICEDCKLSFGRDMRVNEVEEQEELEEQLA